MVKETHKIGPVSFSYKGYFDFNIPAQAVRKWMKARLYNFKIKRQTKKPLEQETVFHGDLKITEYLQYEIQVFMKAWDIKRVEIIKDGKKVPVYQGHFKIDVTGKYHLDWIPKFTKETFTQHIQKFYHRYIIKNKIMNQWEDELQSHAFEVTEVVKKAIGAET